ncbi:hypothetical protein N7475_000678 [Penicillium sp. IBT 31633x]|nr:hypothetical protein N7475_000678 [Penicillium sp. IBT 31633x]
MFALLPSAAESVCHSPSLNHDLFSWNRLTAPLILVSLFGGYLRLVAYMQLRENFTFRLARPSQIVKTGIYAWVQHPSYSGAALLIFCYCGLVMRADGVLSCWLGGILLHGIVYANWVYLVWAVTVVFPLRITKEEKMLRDGVGKEWEDYNRQTARLVPHVF